MNKYLKELAQLAEFDDDVTITRISGKEKVESVKKKHELLRPTQAREPL
jgi:hypothetical protein